jgi:hypothetical protein
MFDKFRSALQKFFDLIHSSSLNWASLELLITSFMSKAFSDCWSFCSKVLSLAALKQLRQSSTIIKANWKFQSPQSSSNAQKNHSMKPIWLNLYRQHLPSLKNPSTVFLMKLHPSLPSTNSASPVSWAQNIYQNRFPLLVTVDKETRTWLKCDDIVSFS